MPVGAIAGAGALLGGIGGAIKSGPDLNMSGRTGMQNSINNYAGLVAAGPGQQDVGNSLAASRQFGDILAQTASSGMYDSAAGGRLAEQQFAPQRQALAQSIQDQMATANRAATAAGRSSNDPILRARLGAEAMRQTASLNSQQYGAAMDLGRQSVQDMLNLRGQRVNLLQDLSNQAFSNQQNLFGMNQNLFQSDLGAAQYEAGRGGGFKGALTGALTGAGAGMQFAQGWSGMQDASKVANAQSNMMNSFAKSVPALAQMGANMTTPQGPMYGPMAPPPYVNPYAGQVASSAPQIGPSSMSALGYAPQGVNWLAQSRNGPRGY